LPTSDLRAVRKAGYSEAEITEILVHVVLNVLANYFNVATDVEIDFPKVSDRINPGREPVTAHRHLKDRRARRKPHRGGRNG